MFLVIAVGLVLVLMIVLVLVVIDVVVVGIAVLEAAVAVGPIVLIAAFFVVVGFAGSVVIAGVWNCLC